MSALAVTGENRDFSFFFLVLLLCVIVICFGLSKNARALDEQLRVENGNNLLLGNSEYMVVQVECFGVNELIT